MNLQLQPQLQEPVMKAGGGFGGTKVGSRQRFERGVIFHGLKAGVQVR